ncbi:MAG: glycosyltransferase family 87 protein [Pseudomonadota bacterium]
MAGKFHQIGFYALAAVFTIVVVASASEFIADDAVGYYIAGHFANLNDWTFVYPYGFPAESRDAMDFRSQVAALNIRPEPGFSPFIYPPLWAKVLGLANSLLEFGQFKYVMAAIVAVSLLLMAEAARHIVDASIDPAKALLLQIGLWATTTAGFVILNELQFQAFVSALILCAFWLGSTDRPNSAGLCLALAASIKLTPALLIVLWIAQRKWRPLIAFAMFGGALGLLSLGLAGIEAHQTYLAAIGLLNESVVVRYTSLGLNAVYAILFDPTLSGVFSGKAPDSYQDFKIAIPTLQAILPRIGLVALLGFVAWRGQHLFGKAILSKGLGSLILIIALIAPLSWSHHYLSAFMLIPLFYLRSQNPFWLWTFGLCLFCLSMFWVFLILEDRILLTITMPLIGSAFTLFYLSILIGRSRNSEIHRG